MTAGYSGTPLPKKLGLQAGARVAALDAPEAYEDLLGPLPVGATISRHFRHDADLVHVFVTQRDALAASLQALRTAIRADTPVWVSWPKKASKVPTSVTEDTIREIALPLGFVDVKVCAVSDVWSGLKLVIRKEQRPTQPRA